MEGLEARKGQNSHTSHQVMTVTACVQGSFSLLISYKTSWVKGIYSTCQPFLMQGCDISIKICGISSLISQNALKPSQDLQKQSKLSEDTFNIYRSRCQDILCQAQSLLFQKLENVGWNNCHLHALFNPLLLWVQIAHLHVAYFPDVPQNNTAATSQILLLVDNTKCSWNFTVWWKCFNYLPEEVAD